MYEEMIYRIGSYELVLQKVKRRNMSWFRHDILANTDISNIKEIAQKRIGWTTSMSGPVCLPNPYLMK